MMTVEDFHHTFVHLCREHHVEPQEIILNRLKKCKGEGGKGRGMCLDLSTHSLSAKTCAVLAKVIATDRLFSEIKLNDGMIPEEGMKALAHGLADNVACKKLDIKGNNIRGSAAEGLGKMLRQNQHILSLCLEWNALGMMDSAFGVFCDGMSVNTRLQVLDLRNNQISHDGATELAAALKRNATLRSLDLRWNNVGLIGGRALLGALDVNKTLVKLDLAGNNIPLDVLNSIATSVSHNADRASLTDSMMNRQHTLSTEIQHLKKSKKLEMTDLINKLEGQEAAIRKTNRSAAERISMLQAALEERKEQFNTLSAKMSVMSSELALSESKVSELGNMLSTSKDEQEESRRISQAEQKRERQDHALTEGKLKKEIMAMNDKNMQLENKVDELDRKTRSQQEEIFELKEALTHAHAEIKMKAAQCDERLQFEKQKLKDAMKDLEEATQREVERTRREASECERALTERLERQEAAKRHLEEELTRQRALAASDRLHAEEQLLTAKQTMRQDQDQRCHMLEEKVRMLSQTKDDMMSHSTQQGNNITDLQGKNANLVLENESLKRRIEDLGQDLSGKNSEMTAEVGKVRIELNQKIQRLENERLTQSELYDKISLLEKQLAESAASHQAALEDRRREIEQLREAVRTKEADMKRLTDADSQRTVLLQSAIQSFVSKSPYSGNS